MPLAAKITVKKTLVPTSDSGRFDLLVGSTVVAPAAGNGGSGTTTVGPGTFTVKENASSGNLANYVTLDRMHEERSSRRLRHRHEHPGHGRGRGCGGLHDHEQAQGNDHAAQVALADERHRQVQPDRRDQDARLRRRKRRLRLSSSFAPTSYTLKETAASGTTLSNYTSSIACTRNGGSGPSGNGTSLTVSVSPADVLNCTFTNVRKAKITVTKSLSPTSDPGRFNLLVGSTNVKPSAGNGGSGSTLVTPGSYTVSENAASGTSLSHYTSSIACTKNGSPHKSGPGTSISVSVAAGDVEACTITNVRK